MESNLCVICFMDDDRHLAKVGEKGLENLLRYIKFHCDEKLEKLFSESSQVFVQVILMINGSTILELHHQIRRSN